MSRYVPPHLRGKVSANVVQPARKNIVFVGLDQWVMTDINECGTNVGLFTGGLSGCVAIALIGETKACLAHLYSRCNVDNWVEYAHQLDLALVWMRRNGGSVISCNLYAAEPELKSESWRCNTISEYVVHNCPNVDEVRVSKSTKVLLTYREGMFSGWGADIYKSAIDIRNTDTCYNTVTGRPYFTVYGMLSGSGAPSG